MPSRARGDAGWGPNPPCTGGSMMRATGRASPPLLDHFLWSQQQPGERGGPQPSSRTSPPSRSAGICSLPSPQCSQSSSYWFLQEEADAWGLPRLLQPVVQPGWSGMTGRTAGTHLARSRRLAPAGFLRDPASPAPLDSLGHLWTLQQEREGSRSRTRNFRASILQGSGPPDRQHPRARMCVGSPSRMYMCMRGFPSKSLCPKPPCCPAGGVPRAPQADP